MFEFMSRDFFVTVNEYSIVKHLIHENDLSMQK